VKSSFAYNSKEKTMIFEYPFNTHLLCTDG